MGFVTQKIFMSSIIKKTYHIRKYENIEDEMNKKLARGQGGALRNDDESSGRSERNKIYPVDTWNEGGEEEEDDDRPKDPFQL